MGDHAATPCCTRAQALYRRLPLRRPSHGILVSTLAGLSLSIPKPRTSTTAESAEADYPLIAKNGDPGGVFLSPPPVVILTFIRTTIHLSRKLHEHAVEETEAEVRCQSRDMRVRWMFSSSFMADHEQNCSSTPCE